MRILATFALSFSAAVFAAVYLPLDGVLLPAGVLLLLAAAGARLMHRRRVRRRALLVLCGAALGLLWTAGYTALFLRPAQALDGRTVRLTAQVAGFPQAGSYGGWSVLARVECEPGVRLSAVLYLDGQGEDLRPGDRITTVAHCTLGSRTFAGEEITYYTAKGIFLRARAYGLLEVERPERIPLGYWSVRLSQALKSGIDAAFPPEEAALVRALVTGNRDNLTDAFTTSLQRTGLSHTVAVSGMHLAFLSQLLTALLGRGKRSTALLTCVWVAVFCGVAGNTPSVLRAAVMILMLQAAPLLGRERDGPTSLALALLLLLAWNPLSAAHVGLQLSFAAVAGILLLSDRVQDGLLACLGLDRPAQGLPAQLLRAPLYFAVSTLTATLGASLFTIPLTAIHFRTVSLIAPLANLATIWAISILFLGGLLAGLAGIALPGLGAALGLLFVPLARYLDWAVTLLARPAWAALPLGSPYYWMWLVLVYLLAGATAACRERRVWLPVGCGLFALGLAVLLAGRTFQRGEMTAAVLDVGQGQCVLLRMGRTTVLVDCGGDSGDSAGDIAADYLQSAGITALDLLVVSHYHDDHANGVPQLLGRMGVSALALPDVEPDSPLRREILAQAQVQGTRVDFIRADTRLDLDGNKSLTLFPPLGQGSQTNELGLTVLAAAGAFEVLITGDMGGEVEQLLLSHAALPDIELLVAGHHGSKYSTTPELLSAVRPELAVISAGKGNRYGHPAQETLERLAQAGAEVYRTDLQGTVEVRFHPDK